MSKPTHVISLNCTVSDPDAWDSVWTQFCTTAAKLGYQSVVADVNVSSEQIPDDENHTENTLFKVRASLREAGVEEIGIDDAINTMQNMGILFRERS